MGRVKLRDIRDAQPGPLVTAKVQEGSLLTLFARDEHPGRVLVYRTST